MTFCRVTEAALALFLILTLVNGPLWAQSGTSSALAGSVLDKSGARDGSKVRHMWAAFLGAVGGGLSLYFGYMSHLNLLAMISSKNIDPYDRVYLFSSHAQFYTLLAGAFFFADFAVHDLSKED
jgi:hypothetical protein